MGGSGKLKKFIQEPNSSTIIAWLIRLHLSGGLPTDSESMRQEWATLSEASNLSGSQLLQRLKSIGFIEQEKGGKFKWDSGLLNNLRVLLKDKEFVKEAGKAGAQQTKCTRIRPTPAIDDFQVVTSNRQQAFLLKGGTKCHFVNTISRLRELVAADDHLSACNLGNRASSPTYVSVDCKGVSESLELLQVVTSTAVYVIDGQTIRPRQICEVLLPLFQSHDIVKVFHDLRQDVRALNEFGNARPVSVIDSQLMSEHLFGEFSLGLNPLLKRLGIAQHPSKEFMHARMKVKEDFWVKRPLPQTDIEHAAFEASLLHTAFPEMMKRMEHGSYEALTAASMERMMTALEHGPSRCFCFDLSRDYGLSSAELIRALREHDGFFGGPLRVHHEIEDVLRVLPGKFRQKLVVNQFEPGRGELKQSGIDIEQISDINIDQGSRPQCWVDGRRVFLVDDEDALACKEDVEEIVEKLGVVGSDNRAGLDGQLHRFSVLRAKDLSISGVTIRVGRWITGNADILMDLLLGCDKSILFLGEPGSGKTTVVREATRILAEEQNVVVVDTSNEIAGDGMMKHKCIGYARRMMVPSLDRQSDVMIECVQNHTPKCMVIDEIGRPKEVLAARTVKQRGVRIIGSAHGDLRKLVKNRELKGLIGGVEQVTMGDELAKEEAKKRQAILRQDGDVSAPLTVKKTKAQRGGEPTFDVVVEVRRGAFHEWRVVRDVAEAVDRILEGRMYKLERRTRNPLSGAMFLEFDEG